MTRLILPLEDELAEQIRNARLPEYPLRQWRWHLTRRWRADFGWPLAYLLVEVDGGQWKQGTGHNTGTGRERDCIKDAEAALLGFATMRFTTNLVRSGKALEYIKRYLDCRVNHPA